MPIEDDPYRQTTLPFEYVPRTWVLAEQLIQLQRDAYMPDLLRTRSVIDNYNNEFKVVETREELVASFERADRFGLIHATLANGKKVSVVKNSVYSIVEQEG